MFNDNSNQEVFSALDSLNRTLTKEKQRIYTAGSDTIRQPDHKSARSLLDFAE